MEKEKVFRQHASLWSLFDFRNIRGLVVWNSPLAFTPTHSQATIKKQKGFTLIELLVVISILAIAGAATFFLLDPVTQLRKANDAKRKSDLSEIQKALEQYYNDHGAYPSVTAHAITGASWGLAWGNYMQFVPKDPSSARNYVYASDTTQYWLYASLENTKDPQLCNAGAACASAGSSRNNVATLCGSNNTCNYQVYSPNATP